MKKNCLKCGNPISNLISSDYCINCSNILYNEKKEMEEKTITTQKCTKCGIIFSGNGEYCSRCRNSHSIDNSLKSNSNAENVLTTIANITLIVGIITSVILIFIGIGYCDSYSSKSLGIMLLLSIIPLLFSSIVTWGVLKVICNISNTLKELNLKIK